MQTSTSVKNTPLKAQNELLLVAGFIMPFLYFCYGTQDHLGATRMVLGAQDNDGCDIIQALMYQPYGTVSDVGVIRTPEPDPYRCPC